MQGDTTPKSNVRSKGSGIGDGQIHASLHNVLTTTHPGRARWQNHPGDNSERHLQHYGYNCGIERYCGDLPISLTSMNDFVCFSPMLHFLSSQPPHAE